MNQIAANEIGMQELTMNEVEDVSGGIINFIVISFAAGYWVGTQLYNAIAR